MLAFLFRGNIQSVALSFGGWDSQPVCPYCHQLGMVQKEDSLAFDRCSSCIGQEWNQTDKAKERRDFLREAHERYFSGAK